ncbi:MAG TPA: hypothetical protein VFZ25_01960, partial [Chloroflexota bacterium]|nr:hypothetical protein [Chloroflexota bacterium]
MPAGDAAQVQRVIATQPAALLVNAPASLNGRLTTIGTLITQYNVAAQNVALSQRKRMKKQFLLLRKLRRAIYGAMNRISQRTEELSADPIAQRLHALQGEADVEHRQLVQTMVNNPGLINQVTPFKTQGMNPGQVNAAKALWTSLMTGTGKVKLTGDAANQEKVQSWLTQLMDTEHGRAILASLNSADARAPLNDELTNVYIGQRPGQMPGTVTGNAAYNPMMQANPHEAQAQPLKDENATKLAAHQGAVANHNAVTNAGEFVDEVLAGNRGVQMNGAEYDFNAASTGSFVNMEESAQFPTALGSTQQVAGQQQHPEIYMPDWLLLGHELGHSANMRAGSATNARPMLGNATTNAFSAQWSGMAPQAREANWYGGSEEYINIVGNENRLRTQAGLRERAGHVSPKVPRLQQRGAAITNAFNAGA